MNNLPTEILHSIFILLPIIQKQECMLVCRKWADIIQTRSLLDTVSIINNPVLFEKFIDLVKQQPVLGQQVKTLIAPLCINQIHDTRELHFLFPNLKVTTMTQDSSTTTTENQTVHQNQFELIPSRSHLECFRTSYPCEFTQALLTSGLCSHLVILELRLESANAPRDIVSQLKGMPSLKTLDLSNIPISVEDCEMMHKNLPSLTTFELWASEFFENTTSLNISPAYSMTRLVIGASDDDPEEPIQIDWLQYISKKYPNLTHLGYFLDYDESFSRKSEEIRQQGYLTALNSMCSTLKSLDTFYIDEKMTLFELLDESNCQINSLKFIALYVDSVDGLTQFKQFKYIETLHLLDFSPTLFTWLGHIESLKTLSLEYSQELETSIDDPLGPVTININNLLELCGDSIESLEAKPHFIDFDLNANRQFSIKRLELQASMVPPRFDVFARLSLPHLHELSLGKKIANGTALNFSSHRFSKVELNFRRFDFEIVILDDNKVLYYSTDKSKRPNDYSLLAAEIAPVLKKDISSSDFVTFVCASVKDLYLNNKHAYFL